MKYYMANREANDYFNGCSVVKGELLTKKERDTKCRYLTDDYFDVVEVNRNLTYKQFGKRFKSREY